MKRRLRIKVLYDGFIFFTFKEKLLMFTWHFFLLILVNEKCLHLTLHKIPLFQLLYQCETFVKTDNFSRVSGEHDKFSEHFLPPNTHTYVCISGGKKCSFFGKLGMLALKSAETVSFHKIATPGNQVKLWCFMQCHCNKNTFIFHTCIYNLNQRFGRSENEI